MKIVYFIQTYKNPSQIKRLVNTIKISSLNSQILISHDSNSSTVLNKSDFESIPGVNLIYNRGGRGDFYTVESYLNSLRWLFDNQMEFDWIVNISGQDYPIQPLPLLEQFLSKTEYDGFLEYRDVLSKDSYHGLKEGVERYYCQYWHSGIYLLPWQKALIKPIKVLLNNIQGFVKVSTSYQLSIGIKSFQNIFDEKFKCYGGALYKILSNRCAKYLYKTAEEQVHLVDFYKKTLVPEESFMQTILANSNLFNLCDKNLFYSDWSGSKHGSPKILTVADYSTLTNTEDYYFARKFDPAVDSEILDRLDKHIFEQLGLELGQRQ